MFQVIRVQLFHWIAAHMAPANMCIGVYLASQTDDSIDSRCWLTPVRSNDTMVWSNLCFLDARHFSILPEFIEQIQQVKSSADNEAVIFLLKLPEKHIKLWRDVLTRAFSEQQGYRNVMQYYCEDDFGNTIGQAVLCLGELHATTVLVHVDILKAPPAYGCAEFNQSVLYTEIKFYNAKSATNYTIGILWSPDVFCIDKYYFNSVNYSGVITWMVTALALQRSQVLCGSIEVLSVNTAIDTLRAHLDGLLVVTDMRSKYFDDRFPLHQWRISGKVHAVQGLFTNGSFQDACANEKLACTPACYRLRCRPQPYFLATHSFDFWSEDFLLPTVYKPPVPVHEIEVFPYLNLPSCDRTQSLVCLDTCSPSSVSGVTDTTASPDTSPASTSSASSEMYGGSLDHDEGSMSSEMQYDAEPECMVCLSRVPHWVFASCGHLGLCGDCRKWMCKAQFNKHKSEQCQVSPSKLTMNKAGKVMLQCPYCRRTTQLVHHTEHQGTTYAV